METVSFSVELEQVVLGALMLDNNLLTAAVIEASWFYDPVHQRIMERIAGRIGRGELASPVTMRSELSGDPGLQELGGPSYLARMAGVALTNREIYTAHVKELRALWARRTMVETLKAGVSQLSSFEPGEDPSATISRIENEIATVQATASSRPLVKSWLKTGTGAIDQILTAYQGGGLIGTPTGIKAIDDHVGGFAPGEMIVLAGRPSMGKTAIALGVAWSVAERGLPVFFGSLEMPAEQLMVRWYSRTLRQRGYEVPYKRIRTGRLSENELRQIVELASEVQSMPLQFAERECRSIPRLRSAARRAAQVSGGPLGLIVVDYLQLLEDPTAKSDYARVSNASGALKSLAMDMGCPVLALSQLSRGVEAREPPVPRLSDLRDSGKVEEDADTILLCYREWYYLSKMLEETPNNDLQTKAKIMARMDECQFDVSLFIPKMRGGETGKIELIYQPAYNMIDTPTKPWDTPRLPYED